MVHELFLAPTVPPVLEFLSKARLVIKKTMVVL